MQISHDIGSIFVVLLGRRVSQAAGVLTQQTPSTWTPWEPCWDPPIRIIFLLGIVGGRSWGSAGYFFGFCGRSLGAFGVQGVALPSPSSRKVPLQTLSSCSTWEIYSFIASAEYGKLTWGACVMRCPVGMGNWQPACFLRVYCTYNLWPPSSASHVANDIP